MTNKIDFIKNRANCKFCGLWERCRNPFVLYQLEKIPRSIKYFFIGEAPGEQEDFHGEPFVGRAGQLLWDCLTEAGFDRSEIYISNILKCRPPKNETPTDKQVEYCIDILLHELALLSPKVVVLMGATATKAFGFKKAISLLRSDVFTGADLKYRYRWDTSSVFCTFHPAFILRSMDKVEDFIADLTRIKDYSNDSLKTIESTFYLDKTGAYEKELPFVNSKVIAVDVETDGLEFPCKVLSVSISDGETSICYQWNEEAKVLLNILFQRVDTILAHNWVFEWKAFTQEGVKCNWIPDNTVSKLRDTMIMSALLNENRQSHGLKELAYLIGFGGYENKYLPCKITEIDKVPIEQWYKYNCADSYVSVRLYEYWIDEIRELGMEPLFKELSKYQAIIAELETNGIKVDVPLLEKYKVIIRQDIEDIESRLKTFIAEKKYGVTGKKDFNFNSSQQLGDLIENFLHLKIYERTDKGKPSTAKEVIQRLSEENPKITFFKDLILYKKLMKLESTYVVGLLENVKSNQRAYPTYHILGAITGRMSASNPNIQNIPIESALEDIKKYNIRKVFIPADGYKLVQIDYSQLELRVMAVIANDKAMIDCFRRGEDIHKRTADALGVDRKTAKSINFGIIYGGDAGTLKGAVSKAGVKLTIFEAETYHKKFFAEYQGIAKFFEFVEAKLFKDGFVENFYGRRRRFNIQHREGWDIPSHVRNSAINAPVQSTARDLVFIGTNRLLNIIKDPSFKDAPKLIGDVHDALLFECRERHLKMFYRILRDTLVESFKSEFPVPLDIDISVGESWGALEKVK